MRCIRIRLYENGIRVDLEEPDLLTNLEREALYDLSLVVPAYNEEKRLPVMMKDTLAVRPSQTSNPPSLVS